jgi:integrase
MVHKRVVSAPRKTHKPLTITLNSGHPRSNENRSGAAASRKVAGHESRPLFFAKVRVAGSNPVFRSKEVPGQDAFWTTRQDDLLGALLFHSTIPLWQRPGELPNLGGTGVTDRRRRRGSGGIVRVADGTWRVDIDLPGDAVTGRRRRVSRTVKGTREEAELALARLRVAGHQKRLPAGGTNARSVGAAMDLYIEAADSGSLELTPKTVTTTRSAVRIMKDMELADGRRFGAIRLSRLTWQDIEILYAAMRASGRGPDWIRRCATVLTRSLEFARKRDLIDSNPSRDAVRPKSTRKKPFAPLEGDVRAVLKAVAKLDPEIADLATVLASTGMRTGEVLGLQWGDVQLDADEVHVAAAITDGGPGVGIVRKSTKRSDWRDVPLTLAARAALKRQSDRFQRANGRSPRATAYVFGDSVDPVNPLRPDALSRRWAAARGTSSMTLLDLRHYVATVMLDAGESYRTVADILGNSETTLRLHYDGRTGVEKRKAVSALEL